MMPGTGEPVQWSGPQQPGPASFSNPASRRVVSADASSGPLQVAAENLRWRRPGLSSRDTLSLSCTATLQDLSHPTHARRQIPPTRRRVPRTGTSLMMAYLGRLLPVTDGAADSRSHLPLRSDHAPLSRNVF